MSGLNTVSNPKLSVLAATALVATTLVSGSPAKADMAAAQALIDKHRAVPTFTPPGPAFDAKACMAGKKIFQIPLSMTNPFNVAIAKSMSEGAKAVGFKFTVWENQAKMDQWVQGMATAVGEKYDLIDLQGGIPPAALGPQIQDAHAKGVKVTTTHLYDVTQPIEPMVDGSTRDNYTEAGQIMAAWAITHTGGKVNAVIIGTDEVVPTKAFVKAIENYLDANALPGSKHKYINVPFPEWGTKIQPSVQSSIVADPTINYILPIYDNMATFVIPALRITNTQDKIKIATFNGSPNMLDMQREGNIEMNVGESLGWVGLSALDAEMRMLCGKGKVTELNSPLLIFDKNNVKTAGVPADFDKGYGDADIEGFHKLWGLK